jgi:predicted nuclease of predicted toxin-antitoxin system
VLQEDIDFLNDDVTSDSDDDLSEIKQKINVLILGFDSVSNNHFKRIFPKTFKYLNEILKNNIIYSSFNSVGVSYRLLN